MSKMFFFITLLFILVIFIYFSMSLFLRSIPIFDADSLEMPYGFYRFLEEETYYPEIEYTYVRGGDVPFGYEITIKYESNIFSDLVYPPVYSYQAIRVTKNSRVAVPVFLLPENWYIEVSHDNTPVSKTSFKYIVYSALVFSLTNMNQSSCDIYIECKANRRELLQYLDSFTRVYRLTLRVRPGTADSHILYIPGKTSAIYIN